MKAKQTIVATCYDSKGRVVSQGRNSYTLTHPVQARYAARASMPDRVFLHAEIAAIIRAKGKAIHKLVVKRYGKDGRLKLAQPCPVCQLAIKEAGIKVVVHS